MNQQCVHAALVAAFIVQMTGCESSMPEPGVSSQQRVIEALKMAPKQGPVELTVGYCNSQSDVPARKQIVNFGDTAVFKPAKETMYELTVKPFNAQGKMITQVWAQWDDKVQRRTIVFTGQFVTSDGQIGPQSVLTVNGGDSCFTVTAQSVPRVGS